MYFQDFVFVAFFGEFHRVVVEVEGDKTQLRDEAVFHLIDVRGHEQTA